MGIGAVGPIISAGGTRINQAYPSATFITNATGNSVSINSTQYIDTLGVVAATASPNVNAPTSVSWTDVNGGSPHVTVNTSNVKFQTNFGCTGFGGPVIAEVPAGSLAPQFSGLSYPDGSSLSVTYEDTYGMTGYVTGRIKTLTIPTGGQVTYTYGGVNCFNGSFDTLSRVTSDGTTSYSVTPAGTGYGATTTVTDPGGNKSVYQFSKPSTNGYVVLTMMQVYKGTSTLLKQVNYCYNSDTTHCTASTSPYAIVSFPITQETVYTTPNGSSMTRESAYTFDFYGNKLTDAEYDFGAGSPTSTTTIAYGSWNGSNCIAVSSTIQNKPCTTITTMGANNVAQSRFTYDGNGNLTKTYKWNGSAWLSNTTANTYNTNGTISSFYDLANNPATYAYNGTGGCNGLFPTSVTSGGLTTYDTWDCTGGVIKTRKDANGNTTTYGYANISGTAEPFWRVSSVTDPLSNEAWQTYTANSQTGLLTFNSSLSVANPTGLVDSYGFAVRNQVREGPSASNYDTVSSAYGWSGNYRQMQSTMPCAVASGSDCSFSSGVTTKLLDPLGRPYTMTDGGGGVDTFTYAQNDVLSVLGPAPSFDGENTKGSQNEFDGLGRIKSKCDILSSGGTNCGQASGSYSGVLTSYLYSSASGSQTTTATRGSQVRTKVFDALGRVTAVTIPEGGTTHYYYDSSYGSCPSGYTGATGQLEAAVDPNGNVLCYKYDSLNRVTGVNANGTACRLFYYDNSTGFSGTIPAGITISNKYGKMVEAATSNCSTTLITDEWFSYDANGRIADMWEKTPNSGSSYYHSTTTYAGNGAVASVNLIGQYTATFGLDGEGRQNALNLGASNTITASTFNAANQLTEMDFGSGSDKDKYTYDGTTGRMTAWEFDVGTQSETASLSWNPIGTLKELSITDGFNSGGTQDCKYGTTTNKGYDDLNRLIYDDCGSGGWGQSFSYDQYDNLTKAVVSGRTGVAWNPGYSSSTNHVTGVTYDSNGDITNDTFHAHEWNEFGKLKSVDRSGTGCATSGTCLIYDALGREVEFDSGLTKTEIWMTPFGVAYMNGPSYLYAYWTLSPGNSTVLHLSGGTIQYHHKDWLGSSRVSSLGGTTIIDDRAFAPYGELYDNFGTTNANELIFTGNTANTVGGWLYDTPNRNLNPSQGRWLSPDPAGSGWNQYAYGTNPNIEIDPTGLNVMHGCFPPCDGGDGGLTPSSGPLSWGDNWDGTMYSPWNISWSSSGDLTAALQQLMDSINAVMMAPFRPALQAVPWEMLDKIIALVEAVNPAPYTIVALGLAGTDRTSLKQANYWGYQVRDSDWNKVGEVTITENLLQIEDPINITPPKGNSYYSPNGYFVDTLGFTNNDGPLPYGAMETLQTFDLTVNGATYTNVGPINILTITGQNGTLIVGQPTAVKP
jgi:RHS repeat-associated protein